MRRNRRKAAISCTPDIFGRMKWDGTSPLSRTLFVNPVFTPAFIPISVAGDGTGQSVEGNGNRYIAARQYFNKTEENFLFCIVYKKNKFR